MQKRYVRWIAAIAVAGTTVLTGAAAGSASAGVRTPQQISPAACAALSADLAGTVAQAAKGLAVTPPDLSGVTQLIAQANKLQDAFKSLNCTAVALPPAPTTPSSPSTPSLPSAPSLPPLPTGSPGPSLPSPPSAPSVPGLSGIPGHIPGLDNIPGLPPISVQ